MEAEAAMNWKYVVLEHPVGGLIPIIFAPVLSHHDMSAAFPTSLPVSAGFVRRVDTGLCCYGSSDSLGIGVGEDDEILISRLLAP